MGLYGRMTLGGLRRLSVLAMLSTPTGALRLNLAEMGEKGRDPPLCFTVEHAGYALRGCYKRPGLGDRGEVFEHDDTYITLVPDDDSTATTASCLEGCAKIIPSNRTDGNYSQVAVRGHRYELSPT